MSRHQAEALYTAVIEWRDKHKPTCEESIWQVDSFVIASQELAEELCNIVGFYDGDDE